jgi:serralysin
MRAQSPLFLHSTGGLTLIKERPPETTDAALIDPGGVMAIVSGTTGDDFIHRDGDGLVPPPGFTEITGVTTDADTINGFEGNDIINGDAVNDTITGGKGNDTVNAGDGNDLIVWRSGDAGDLVNGGNDIDTLQLVISSVPDPPIFDPLQNPNRGSGYRGEIKVSGSNTIFQSPPGFFTGSGAVLFGVFTITVTNVERFEFIGGDGDDALFVGGLEDTSINFVKFSGGAGKDILKPTDFYEGSTTEVLIFADGGDGDDSLATGSANDTLSGGAGNDTLDGGAGVDTGVFGGKLADHNIDFRNLTLTSIGGTDTARNIENFQFADGTVVQDSDITVDDLFYALRNPDVWAAGVDPDSHYATFGWKEGRDPNPFFSTIGYLGANPDVKAAGVNPLDHYNQFGWKEGRDPGGNFDTSFYLIHAPDVAQAGVNALEHYLQYGRFEARLTLAAVAFPGTIPSTDFDPEFYLLSNTDVAAAGVNPSDHFLIFGWKEGRDPNGLFDTSFYLSQNPDVAASGTNPLLHYGQFGWEEGRDPSALFSTSGYLAANPDVAAAGVNPLDHFLHFGLYEGRLP